MPLTPNNRNEAWMKGMVDGSTTLEPNNRKEHWYKEIVDAIGSGGGGGGGALLIYLNDTAMATPPSWIESLVSDGNVYETNVTYAQFHTAYLSTLVGISTPASEDFTEYRQQQIANIVDFGFIEMLNLFYVEVTWYKNVNGSLTPIEAYLCANAEDGNLYFIAQQEG